MAAMSVRTPDPNPGWLSEIALHETRSRVPILYVEAVPIRVDSLGQLEQVGDPDRLARLDLPRR